MTLEGSGSHDEEGEGEGHDHDEHEEELHSAFHAEYKLTCADPVSLEEVAFPYFDHFPRAEELDVTVITDDRQMSHEVGRAAPRMALK